MAKLKKEELLEYLELMRSCSKGITDRWKLTADYYEQAQQQIKEILEEYFDDKNKQKRT